MATTSRSSDSSRWRPQWICHGLLTMLLVIVASSCSNATPTGVALDEAGNMRIYYGSCRDQDRIATIRIWDNDHYEGQPVWMAKVMVDGKATRSIVASDTVPGYEITGTVSRIYSDRDRPYTYEALGFKGNLIGGGFRPVNLVPGRILFDSGRSEVLLKWESQHECGTKQ